MPVFSISINWKSLFDLESPDLTIWTVFTFIISIFKRGMKRVPWGNTRERPALFQVQEMPEGHQEDRAQPLTLCSVPPPSSSVSGTEVFVWWAELQEEFYYVLLKADAPKFRWKIIP